MAIALLTSCERVVDRESSDDGFEGEATSPLGGVDVVTCPSSKPWSATITTNDAGFTPELVRVSRGHIVMFFQEEGGADNMVADDGSFRTGDPGETTCLRFGRSGVYPYHSEGNSEGDAGDDAVRGVVEVK